MRRAQRDRRSPVWLFFFPASVTFSRRTRRLPTHMYARAEGSAIFSAINAKMRSSAKLDFGSHECPDTTHTHTYLCVCVCVYRALNMDRFIRNSSRAKATSAAPDDAFFCGSRDEFQRAPRLLSI